MFTTADLVNLRSAQDLHMQDTCKIMVYSAGTVDEYGESASPTYTAGSEIACGLNMRPNMRSVFENAEQDFTSIVFDGDLRLPINTTFKETDRIQITKRFGETINPALTYEIVSPIQRGPSGIRVLLKRVVV